MQEGELSTQDGSGGYPGGRSAPAKNIFQLLVKITNESRLSSLILLFLDYKILLFYVFFQNIWYHIGRLH